jgi:hypothetical protein
MSLHLRLIVVMIDDLLVQLQKLHNMQLMIQAGSEKYSFVDYIGFGHLETKGEFVECHFVSGDTVIMTASTDNIEYTPSVMKYEARMQFLCETIFYLFQAWNSLKD